MIHIGYKVVRVKQGERISAFMCEDTAHVYHQGQWTEPKPGFGPLCVVEHIHEAMNFITLQCEEVWQCEFEQSRLRSVWTPQYKNLLSRMPKETILASRVKLVKKVRTWSIKKRREQRRQREYAKLYDRCKNRR